MIEINPVVNTVNVKIDVDLTAEQMAWMAGLLGSAKGNVLPIELYTKFNDWVFNNGEEIETRMKVNTYLKTGKWDK